MTQTATAKITYNSVQTSAAQSDLPTIAQDLFSLMMRNMASDGFVFTDPLAPGQLFSTPGCIIASPSYAADLGIVDQDYVYNWTRDAAVTAIEIAAANLPTRPGEGSQPLIDYVNFANIAQNNDQTSGQPIGFASYTIEGQPRPNWTEQSDGPALQTLAILRAYPQLDAPTQATAQTVIGKNLNYLLGVYQNPTFNLWEEQKGNSFFARSVQLQCFQAITANAFSIAVPAGVAAAVTWLQNALASHWNATGGYYVSLLPQITSGQDFPYDPNIDIVMACIYGAIPCTDTKLLATAALLRSQWADSTSASFYPINGADQARGLGPLFGRYPGDVYDGDTQAPVKGGHPWALCSANFAQLYYTLANTVSANEAVPFDALSAPFFAQVGISASTAWSQAVTSLQSAGDAILNAIIFHSDHLELSEQFDGTSGYEKSVSDLTWSYAAFLSAVRAKTGIAVLG